MEHTPWSVIQSTEAFIQEHVGTQCNFIIRPQWRYNYSISEDYVSKYKELFDSLTPWISAADLGGRIGDVANKRIYCISFPRVEKMNILSHVNWGHEVGHILGSVWERTHFSALWASEEGTILARARSLLPTGTSSADANLKTAQFLDKTMMLTKRAFSEFISDAVGMHLFGPAAFASLAEFSCRYELDHNPAESNGYPPWRYRLRRIGNGSVVPITLGSRILWHRKLVRYIQWNRQWEALTKDTTDQTVIASDHGCQEAYRVVEVHWPDVWRDVLQQLDPALRVPYDITSRYAAVGALIDRIGRGLPPNEYGRWPDMQPALIADIWNAAWACKVTRSISSADDYEDHLRVLFQLTLKAIEASHVQMTFGKKRIPDTT